MNQKYIEIGGASQRSKIRDESWYKGKTRQVKENCLCNITDGGLCVDWY